MPAIRHSFTAAILCAALPLFTTAPGDPAEQLIARTLGPTPVIDDLRELTDTIGGRPTGSPAMDKAVEWGLAKFSAAGLENVHAEEYTPPRNWLPRVESGEIASPRYAQQPPERNVLRVAAMPFSQSTPEGGLEAEVYDIGSVDAPEFSAAGDKLKGRWLLVHTAQMRGLEDLFKEYFATPPLVAAAKKAGAAGILWISNRPGRLLYRHNLTLDGSMGPLPAALIEREGGERVARLLEAGQTVRVRVTLQNDIQEKPVNRNVVAEIKGLEKSDEVVILGAHLDSWDLGRGALDNGCNAALVIDAARQMMALAKEGRRPRRTLRFMLYSGEELGTYGSWFDARKHRAEMDKLKAVIIYDIGTGRTTGFSLGGRSDMKDAVDRALAPAAGLGPFTQTPDAFMGTDNYDYLVEGVPTLVANQEGGPYLADYHAESDTFDKVDTRELKLNTAIASVLMWNLADGARAPALRQSRKEIKALLKATGVEEQMKLFGIWDDFAAGRRGRPEPGLFKDKEKEKEKK
jgi:Iap family predicted aminopeptidase